MIRTAITVQGTGRAAPLLELRDVTGGWLILSLSAKVGPLSVTDITQVALYAAPYGAEMQSFASSPRELLSIPPAAGSGGYMPLVSGCRQKPFSLAEDFNQFAD